VKPIVENIKRFKNSLGEMSYYEDKIIMGLNHYQSLTIQFHI
jgi:hypothetical protein